MFWRAWRSFARITARTCGNRRRCFASWRNPAPPLVNGIKRKNWRREHKTMATATTTLPIITGGAFLIEDRTADEIFTPEDLSEEYLAIARTVDEFWAKEVEPHLDAIQRHEPGLARGIVKKAAEL